MRTKFMIATAAVLVITFAGTGLAMAPINAVNPDGGGTYTPDSGGRLVVWCQPPGFFQAMVSQDDYGANNVDATCADDFESPSDYAITSIEWWGVHNGPTYYADHFIITFYFHNEDCLAPGPVYTSQTVAYTETADPGGWGYMYSASLAPVLMDANQKYWISIEAYLDTTIYGNWYWMDSTSVWNCSGMIVSPYYGINDWTSLVDLGYPENEAFAFCLYSDETIDTASATWGNLKALYK